MPLITAEHKVDFIDIAKHKDNFFLLPCVINVDKFSMVFKIQARKELCLDVDKKYVLFAGAFDNKVKMLN